MKRYTWTLRPLTPIHIGTGEEISPLEYLVRDVEVEGDRLPYLFRFDPGQVLARLSQEAPETARRIVDQRDPGRIAAELVAHVDTERDKMYFAMCSPEVAELYDRKILAPENQLLVATMARQPGTWLPLIPGSSLKGAVRTAVLAAWAKGRHFETGDRSWVQRAEQQIAGHHGANDDPFRGLAVSDVILGDLEDGIVDEVVNYSRKTRRFNRIQMIKEMIADVFGWPEVQVQPCEVRIDDRLAKTSYRKNSREQMAVSRSVSMEEIIDACHRFYRQRAEEELERFYMADNTRDARDRYERILQEYPTNATANGEFLLRIGHFSHFESVTIDAKLARPPRRGSGSSRSLAGGRWPMGWLGVKVAEVK